jgi:beta-glucosidase
MRAYSRLLLLILFLAISTPDPAQSAPTATADLEQRVQAILSKMTLEEKIDYIGGADDFYIRAVPRLGLPAFKMSDGPIGLRNDGPATTLAGGIALAATWDEDLVRRAGVTLGDDARARGVHFLLGPAVNIYRAPMAGRNFEYFGEDPYLASRTALAYIRGLQSRGVCATIKHFMGNNQEYLRHDADSRIDERTMREIYLPAFETAVKQGKVCAIMDSYNLVNGEHMSQNGRMNNDLAKNEWGFDGIIMSDWDSTYDGVAAVNGGLDIEMPAGAHMNRQTLLPAIKAGTVREATIDDHVRRILRRALQYGWLETNQTDLSIPIYNLEARQVALQTALAGMVLLKNDGGLLPLDATKVKTVAILGPGAYPGQPVGGGSAAVAPFHAVSFLEGLANELGPGVKVTYDPGLPSLSDMADATEFVSDAAAGKKGIMVERFRSGDLTGAPDTTVEPHVNFGFQWPWFHVLPTEYRSVRYSGYYLAKAPGTYDVFVQGPGEDGAYRLFLDGKVVVDNWKRATALVNYVTVDLLPGPHQVRLELRRTFGDPNVRMGILPTSSLVRASASALAAQADAVVVAVGFDPSSESEGADRTFRLPPGQDELIQATLAANRNVIVVITSGGAVDMTRWIDRTPAVLQAWYPGQEGGRALAQLLSGQKNPSGKLPVSFERRWEDNATHDSYYADPATNRLEYSEGIFLGYRHFDRSKIKPLFAFGHGLSYTTFSYRELSVTPASSNLDEPVTVSFEITNTGPREGAEVAQVYVCDTHARVPRPAKELKGFAKVLLKPGETRRVTLPLDRRAFAYYDTAARNWRVDPGDFVIRVGGSSQQLPLEGAFRALP